MSEVINQSAHLAAINGGHALGEDFDAVDFNGLAGGAGDRRRGADFMRESSSSRRSFFSSSSCDCSLARRAAAGVEAVARAGDLFGEASDFIIAAEFGEGAEAADGFESADAGGDAGFAEELQQADFAGGGAMGASAKLGGEVADFDDADAVAIFFAKEGHGVEFVDGDINGDVFKNFDARIFEDLLVDEVFDVLQFFVGDLLKVGEVEAQVLRINKRAGLLDVGAESLAQRGVEEVGAGVIADGGGAEVGINDGVDAVAKARWAASR